jgi:molecular chaperone GrpE
MSELPRPDDHAGAPRPATADAAASAQPDDAAAGFDALTRERDELQDRLLRKTAEFDNYRKRVERERREFADWAAADLVTDVLAVVDDFERALAADAPAEAQPFRQGIEIIHRQLLETLKKRGVTPIETAGQAFDPHLHQAVAYEEAADAPEGAILGELRRGYRLGERLLRPALVRVAKAS